MKIPAASKPIRWWSEIMPLTLLSAACFYLIINWNPILLAVVALPAIVAWFVFGATSLWWVIIGLTPLSINSELFLDSPVNMYLPTEPILLGFLLLSPLLFIQQPIKKAFIRHPITQLTLVYFSWVLITVFTSSNFMVSLKSFVAQMWFVIPVLFLGSILLRDKKNRARFIKVYVISFSLVVAYTFFRLWSHGFPVKASQWLMQPFLKDHTIMGAVLGLTMPYVYLRCFEKKLRWDYRFFWIILGLLFSFVLIYTYSRAAILSLAGAGVLYLFIVFKVQFRYLLGLGVVVIGIIIWSQDILVDRLSQNRKESSGEVMENIESISNISSDASNLERINRWNAAVEMWKDRPWVGWGPGTYQFEYAPFQKSSDLTIISTNIGDVGNAHSEFLGTMAESGGPAFVLFSLFVISVIGTGYNMAIELRGRDRQILLAALLGFTAYFTHGVLNNFLNSDKVSILIWGFTVIIIHYSLDNTHKS